MRICTFSELSKKEVISCMDCSRLGFIIDAEIQLENAQIIAVFVEEPCGLLSFFKKRVLRIPWECIKKIGDDLIIADFIKPLELPSGDCKTGFLKNFFKG